MPHILIVEDDANARAALGELVGAEGFTTALAGSLRDARIQMSRHSPDAVLIDLVLPDGNGMD
ncbi:response regulator, partial [Escherichia coli]